MQRGIAVLCASAVLLGGVEAAAAHETSTPAAIVITGASGSDPRELTVTARLDTSPACRARRKIEIHARYGEWTHRHVWAPGPWERIGTARAGADGAVAARLLRPTLWSMKFKVRRKNLGPRGHKHVCGGDAGGIGFQVG